MGRAPRDPLGPVRLRSSLLASGFWLLASFLCLLAFSRPALAQPTQEEVFQSIKDNVGPSQTDYSKLLPYALVGLGVVILAVLVSQRKRQETATPKPLNHQGKLLREVLKTVPLRAAELKQLRMLADAREERLASPLTLLLCPSLLAQAVQVRQAQGSKGKGKLDRKAVLELARKVGLVTEKKPK
jgi:hypothetical protein